MGHFDWVLEIVLVGLLGVTLVHAIRLERALRSLRQDRTALGEVIAGFDSSTRQAELGIGRLQSIASESAQLVHRRVEQGTKLRDDLVFLTERGETLADRLDTLVRAARSVAQPALAQMPEPPPPQPQAPDPIPKVRSQAERDLLLALRAAS